MKDVLSSEKSSSIIGGTVLNVLQDDKLKYIFAAHGEISLTTKNSEKNLNLRESCLYNLKSWRLKSYAELG